MKSSTVRLSLFVLSALLLIHFPASACINCNKEISNAIFDSTFYPNLFYTLLPFILLAIAVAIISAFSLKKHRLKVLAYPHQNYLSPVPLMAAATVTGIGLGGFIDGIFLHQILQWHEMLSNKILATTYVGKSVNMFWDGIFHAFTLMVTFTGVVLLWKLLNRKDINRSGNVFAGGMLLGWGLFNLLEGIADHQVLKLHNVREVTPDKEMWNVGFLVFSIILIIVGLLISKLKKEDKVYKGL